MDKRYLIFISSTFRDLIAERNEAARAILDLGHIPAGMERFPAMDEEQMRYIQSIIDDCDYYVLIIGDKYGSISPKTSLSYTEMEFDYACGKGLPIIVFEKSPAANSETDSDKREKLEAFRNKVKTGRLVKSWSDTKDLRAEIALSLPQQIKRKPAIGWVRGDTVAPAKSDKNAAIPAIPGLDDPVPPEFLAENAQNIKPPISITWRRLFLTIAGFRFQKERTDNYVKAVLNTFLITPELFVAEFKCKINDGQLEYIRRKFEHLDLISYQNGIWKLTPQGKKVSDANYFARKSQPKSQSTSIYGQV